MHVSITPKQIANTPQYTTCASSWLIIAAFTSASTPLHTHKDRHGMCVCKNENCGHSGWHASGLFMQPLPCSRHPFSSQPQEWHHRFDICWSWWRPWQCQRSGHQHWPEPGLPSSPAWLGTHFLLLLLLHPPTQTANHNWAQCAVTLVMWKSDSQPWALRVAAVLGFPPEQWLMFAVHGMQTCACYADDIGLCTFSAAA